MAGTRALNALLLLVSHLAMMGERVSERLCGGKPLRLNSYISVVQSVCSFGVTNFFSMVDSALLYSVG